jgi:hypothetical protein
VPFKIIPITPLTSGNRHAYARRLVAQIHCLELVGWVDSCSSRIGPCAKARRNILALESYGLEIRVGKLMVEILPGEETSGLRPVEDRTLGLTGLSGKTGTAETSSIVLLRAMVLNTS